MTLYALQQVCMPKINYAMDMQNTYGSRHPVKWEKGSEYTYTDVKMLHRSLEPLI